MRILVIDDHPVVRRGLRRLLEEHFEKLEVGEAADGEEGARRALAERWDIVVLDLSLPGRLGYDVLRDIRASRPSLPVLVLTIHSEEKYAVRILRAGAAGFLMKDVSERELVLAVEKISGGERYITDALAQTLAASVSGEVADPYPALSDREIQVLYYLGNGKSIKEIAARLDLSAKTVSTYRARILEKLKLRTTTELVRYAVSTGLVECDTVP